MHDYEHHKTWEEEHKTDMIVFRWCSKIADHCQAILLISMFVSIVPSFILSAFISKLFPYYKDVITFLTFIAFTFVIWKIIVTHEFTKSIFKSHPQKEDIEEFIHNGLEKKW